MLSQTSVRHIYAEHTERERDESTHSCAHVASASKGITHLLGFLPLLSHLRLGLGLGGSDGFGLGVRCYHSSGIAEERGRR